MSYHDPIPQGLDLRDTIAAEHEQLQQLIRELEQPGEQARVPLLLAGLGTLLERHFEREEGPGGLYEVLAAKAPGLAETLAQLRAEHGTMLASVADLTRRSERPAGGDLRDDVCRCCAQLRRHEARESRMMIDTLSRGSASS